MHVHEYGVGFNGIMSVLQNGHENGVLTWRLRKTAAEWLRLAMGYGSNDTSACA